MTRARARRGDPQTSHDAAASQTPEKLRRSQDAVLRFMKKYGPCTHTFLVEEYTALQALYPALPQQGPSGIRTRCNELERAGLVRDTGRKELLPTKRWAILWEAV